MPIVNSRQYKNKAIIVRTMRYSESPVTVFRIQNRMHKTNMIKSNKFRGDR
jgi:hypothetical protein